MILNLLEIFYVIIIFSKLSVSNFIPNQSIQWFSDDPDIDRNATQVIESRRFIPETHTVITSDGYILTVFRIINPFMNKSTKLKPIYLQHGLFGNSDDFIMNAPGYIETNGIYIEGNVVNNCTAMDSNLVGSTLSFVLSACGYDVWLGNNRGNRYSNKHIILDSDTDMRYWSFNVDHLSAYDVTATINYIMTATNSESIGYIGHSLGTSMMFQLLSTQQKYSEIIRPFIALAPVAYVGNIEAIIFRVGALFERTIGSVSEPFFGMSPSTLTLVDRFLGHFICGNSFFNQFCELLIFSICGFNYPNTNKTRIPAIVGHHLDETSSLILAHLAQRVNNKNFDYYNYGITRNSKVYGQPNPPKYNLSAITSKNIILMSGVNDFLANPTDMDLLRSELTVPIYDDYVMPDDLWNHADFLIGINAGKLMNYKILKLLNDFN